MTVLEQPFLAYEAGAVLRDVSLNEARSWECNRCGQCCSSLMDGVKRDLETDLPLLTWGSRFPADLYEARYGVPLLRPVVRGEGGACIGKAFEIDEDGKPYTAFSCSMLATHHDGTGEGPKTACMLMKAGEDPQDLGSIRPRNCGDFPIFGLEVDGAIIDGHPYVPPTGATPECTWHGIRIVGPWKEAPSWRERWEAQQRGEEVPRAARISEFEGAIERLHERRATVDGSVLKEATNG